MAYTPEYLISIYQRKNRTTRGLDQLIGLCQGVLADGLLDAGEASILHSWLSANWDVRDQWPANVLFARLESALSDGVLTQDETRELLGLLVNLTGGITPSTGGARTVVSSLPVNAPQPAVTFSERSFVVTGEFAMGPRRDVTTLIESLGGVVQDGVRKSTNYLVVGTLGSENWRHAPFGTKILKAVEYREKGVPIAIVSEEHWASQACSSNVR